MTSTPPDHPRPEAPAESGEAEPAAQVGAPSSPEPGYPASYPGGPYPPPGPFAAVPRAPRVPWVNPDRRSHIIGAGVLGGLVVLLAGFGIGYAVAPSGHHDRGPGLRMERGGPYFPGRMVPGPAGQFPQPGNGHRRPPGAPPASTSAAPKTPTPSSTK